MTDQVVLTRETERELKKEKEELEKQLREVSTRLTIVIRKLEALPLFLPQNGTPENAPSEAPIAGGRIHESSLGDVSKQMDKAEGVRAMSLPMAVKLVLSKRGRLTATEIRDAVLAEGVPKEKLGAGFSYLYTVLGRLKESKKIEGSRGKYQLPQGVTIQFRPDEEDLKN